MKPRRTRRGRPRRRRWRAVSPDSRRRGLMNSSMPKFSSARPVPTRAMHMPGGTNQYHSPESGALLACAQNSIVPQFHTDVL